VSRVADDFYLVAHEERSGRCLVPPRVVGVGLAAGLLAELVLSGHLQVISGRVFPRPVDLPPGGRVLRELLSAVHEARMGTGVGDWLDVLTREAVRNVRYRLTLDGTLTEVAVPRLLGRRRRAHLPTDVNAAAWPAIRLANELSRGEPMTPGDMVLSSLVAVTGLLDVVLWLKPDHEPGFLRAAVVREALPAGLGELVAHVDVAVGRSVLAGR